jgi:maltooligosyltrehalose trehalohydrolase
MTLSPGAGYARPQPPDNADDGRSSVQARRLGANIEASGVRFAVWAPHAQTIDVQIGDAAIPLRRSDDGIWGGTIPSIGPGQRYGYGIDGGGGFPDPYSRSQPDGPHGLSEVVDPDAFAWHDDAWRGLSSHGLVIYELHVGTYTQEGTFDALIPKLESLRALGVAAIELMPVAEFPGSRSWGYDGVDLFAPSSRYGGAEGLKRLVDAAHARGLAVVLDVVYNHFGPDGNYLLQFAPEYLTNRHMTPWGDAVNFDGPHSDMVRRFVVDNAVHWITEYHIDGLRLDATFAIIDESPRHILSELSAAVRQAAGDRGVILVAETYENDPRYLATAAAGGLGMDAVWADDFHHVVHTIASHERSGHYADYAGTLEELARTISRGWLFEGQHSVHFDRARGCGSDGLAATHFIYALENHDQVGNRAFGRRFSHLVGAGPHRMWSALLLLLPYTPMLFMGQEFAASSRFHYFTDHKPDLGLDVTKGRRAEFARALGFEDPSKIEAIPDPQAEQTFMASKLNLAERYTGSGAETHRLYAELLALRSRDAVLSRYDRTAMRAFVCHESLLLVHAWHGRDHRLAALNTGVAIDASPAALGIDAALPAMSWRCVITTDERRFGGSGDDARFDADLVSLPPQSVTWLSARERSSAERVLLQLKTVLFAAGARIRRR